MNDPHTTCRADIEAHFSGRISPPAENRMRGHIADCEPCARCYRRYWLLADLDPLAPREHERIGRGLGILRRTAALRPAGGLALALAAAWGIAMFVRRAPVADASFQARGPARAEAAAVEIYHGGHARPFAVATSVIHAGDELAFAYANGASYRYLAVCGVDEHGHVYWYHPGWTRTDEDPQSVPIEGGPLLHELPEAISHAVDGTQLRVVSVFTKTPARVREIEHEIERSERTHRALGSVLSEAFGDSLVLERTLSVTP